MVPHFLRFAPLAALLLALAAVCAPVLAMQNGPARIVRPVAAGAWFPADADALRKLLDELFTKADAAAENDPAGRVAACIVPHAPYATSGPVAASALRLIKPGRYERVIVLAASHNSKFRGCSIPSAQAYVTPLGVVPIDCKLVRDLDRLSPLIEVRSLQYEEVLERQPLHERETSVEVMLPYLQARLGTFLLVPIVVGQFKDYHGAMDEYGIDAVASALKRYVDDKTLIVVSSDFTHFGNNFSYRPFKENILQNIEALDRAAFDLILAKNLKAYYAYLRETKNTICGKEAIALMLKLLPQDAAGNLTGYDISARHSGDTKASISYGGIVFTVPERVQAKK